MVKMTKEDEQTWLDFKVNVTNKLSPEYRKILCKLHSKYYNHKYSEPCTCNGKLYKMWIADLDRKI
tara:strand:- start:532 stop:729 length:198 start_codon:yes stop_codon:yes gene_type:complete